MYARDYLEDLIVCEMNNRDYYIKFDIELLDIILDLFRDNNIIDEIYKLSKD